MKSYLAKVVIANKLEDITFQTDGNPIEYLWEKYGISCYIETITEISDESNNEG